MTIMLYVHCAQDKCNIQLGSADGWDVQDTYTSIIWETQTETLPRPTITITLPSGLPYPTETSTSDSAEQGPDQDEKQDEKPEEWVGEVLRPEPEERPTRVNTVICNTVFFTRSLETQVGVSIVNHGQPKRTITLTVTHTEV